MTKTHHLNETPLDRELRFLDMHLLTLERQQEAYEDLERELENDEPDEDRRHMIYVRMTELEIELVLLEACYDRKAKLEKM